MTTPTPSVEHLAERAKEGSTALEQLRAIPCETPQQKQMFADFLTKIRDIRSTLEEERTKITKPLLESKKQVDTLFKNADRPWEDCEKLTRSKIQTFDQAVLDRRLQAEAEAREAATPSEALRALQSAPEKVEVEGVGGGEEWEALVIDEAAIPREWLTIDWSKVKIHCREHKRSSVIPSVPGFEFKRKATVRAR
jgi:hypothetical protein